MPLIQVTSGGQRSLLKKKLQVCESQQSCLFVGDQILIFHHNLQINYLKILQCDFLDFFSYFVFHSWGIPMMKITGLSHLFKWENLHNWWLTKYFFAPLYIYIYIYAYSILECNGTRTAVVDKVHRSSTWVKVQIRIIKYYSSKSKSTAFWILLKWKYKSTKFFMYLSKKVLIDRFILQFYIDYFI